MSLKLKFDQTRVRLERFYRKSGESGESCTVLAASHYIGEQWMCRQIVCTLLHCTESIQGCSLCVCVCAYRNVMWKMGMWPENGSSQSAAVDSVSRTSTKVHQFAFVASDCTAAAASFSEPSETGDQRKKEEGKLLTNFLETFSFCVNQSEPIKMIKIN